MRAPLRSPMPPPLVAAKLNPLKMTKSLAFWVIFWGIAMVSSAIAPPDSKGDILELDKGDITALGSQ